MYKQEDISTIAQLSAYLRTSEEQLLVLIKGKRIIFDNQKNETLTNDTPTSLISFFERFYIPKRNKKLGFRIVYKALNQHTIDILKVLKFNLDNIYKPIDCVHGFVQGRNTRTNAMPHLGKKYLLKIDIKNFFESINKVQVKNGFTSLGFKETIAEALSEISTLNGRLIQGFSSSPVIANLVCTQLDSELNNLCHKNNWEYTRYADDISISSNIEPPKQGEIVEIIEKFNFKINARKTQRFKQGQNQFVTGLSISDNKYPRIPKAIKRRIKQQLYYLHLHGYHSHICHIHDWDEETDLSTTSHFSHELRNKLKGWIDYIHSIEPIVAKKFYEVFNKIEQADMEERKRYIESIMPKDGILTLSFEIKEPIPRKKGI